MNILNQEIPTSWLVGAELSWVPSVANEESDSGVPAPVARRTRPLMQFSMDILPDDVADVEALFIECNGSANGFFARPPRERYYLETGVALGTGTGSAQQIQLTITRGQTWDALYPVDGTIVIYANGVELTQNVDWTLGALGVITVTATVGHAITGDYQYRTPFQFIDELVIELTQNYDQAKSIIIREIL